MEYDAFVRLLTASLPEGLSMDNPKSGTSTVMICDKERVCYKRGKSRFYIGTRDLYEMYEQCSGRTVTTNELKDMNPSVFDPRNNGHSCHRTFFLMALRQMGIIDEIRGTGLAGNPFSASLRG